MESKATLSNKAISEAFIGTWEKLNENQKGIAKKAWKVLTYKWKWQVAFNAPFMVIWLLDQTIPAVHQFDLMLLSSLSLPEWIKSFTGLK